MRRFEFVWSLLVAFFILCGAITWTNASPPSPRLIATDPVDSWQTSQQRAPCRKYAQYEFKVGYVVSPSCIPQTN
ncbi:MAG: hypothetical protein LC791_03875 [Acidobacteria bacterium]|nr:hypothetical protein [Acidobacteriota bacterium]